jgi:hypothetical protein
MVQALLKIVNASNWTRAAMTMTNPLAYHLIMTIKSFLVQALLKNLFQKLAPVCEAFYSCN